MNATAKDVIEHEGSQAMTSPAGGAVSPYITMMEKAIDKGMGPEELGKFLDLQERWEANQARKAFADAMTQFQAVCPRIGKRGKAKISTKSGGQYEYSFPKLEDIQATIQPHLDAAGLSIAFSNFTLVDGTLTLSCIVRHCEGHSESYPFSVPVDESLSINKMQKVGVSNSYCKRYALCNALNLVGFDVDSDGNMPPTTNFVTREEAANLRDRLEAVDADIKVFCEFMGVSDIFEIPAAKYPRALQAVKAKERKVGAE